MPRKPIDAARSCQEIGARRGARSACEAWSPRRFWSVCCVVPIIRTRDARNPQILPVQGRLRRALSRSGAGHGVCCARFRGSESSDRNAAWGGAARPAQPRLAVPLAGPLGVRLPERAGRARPPGRAVAAGPALPAHRHCGRRARRGAREAALAR